MHLEASKTSRCEAVRQSEIRAAMPTISAPSSYAMRFTAVVRSFLFIISSFCVILIKEGEADLTVNGEQIVLKGEGFFVNFPKSGGVYHARETKPWSIKWVSAGGELVGRYLDLLGITEKRPYLPLKNGREIETIFDEMYDNFDRSSISSRIYCVSLLHKLFSFLSDDMGEKKGKNRYVRSALSIIEKRYAGSELNVFYIAKALNLNPNYFSILFKRETGMPPKRAILELRMRNASKMLRFTDRPIKEISQAVGFTDELYFSRAFHAHYGISPMGYRKKLSYPT